MFVQNRTIAVTGAGSGIGRELVFVLLSKGARVAAIDVNPETLAETTHIAAATAEQLKGYPLDITHRTAVNETVQQIITDFGSVQGLINNAGIIQPFIPVVSLEEHSIRRVMEVNFYGTLNLTQALLPHLMEQPEGHIVNISSMGGFLPVPGQSVYGASKAAVKLLTEGLFAELADTSVRVSVVFPGAVATNIVANSGLTAPSSSDSGEHNALPAHEAAQIIVNGMEKNRFRILVGKDASFLDKLYRFAPKYATNFIRKKMRDLAS